MQGTTELINDGGGASKGHKSFLPEPVQWEIRVYKRLVLNVDPEVQPKKQPLRPIYFHLRDAVEKEIHRQIKDGIFVKVDETSESTPWVSNLVVVHYESADFQIYFVNNAL